MLDVAFGARLALLGAFVGGAVSCATTRIHDVVRILPARQYTLASGLRVIFEEDPTATIVGAVWVVDAGSIDDPAGRYGLAHTVEHLVLATPDANGASSWQRLMDLGGIGVNASTQVEHTTFQVFGPRSQLDSLARVVIGQMAEPLGTAGDATLAATLAGQHGVLAEESDLSSDAAMGDERFLLARLYPASDPYGALARLPEGVSPGLSVADARAFVAAHYQPNRITLVVSGAIPADWDARLFGMMPPRLRGDPATSRAPERRRAQPSSAPTGADASLDRETGHVAQPQLRIGWWLPGARGLDEVPLHILGWVVSRALAHAVEDGTLRGVVGASARTMINDRGGLLTVTLTLHDAAVVEQARVAAVDVVTRQAFSSAKPFAAVRRTILQEVELHTSLDLEELPLRTLTRALLAHDDWSAGIDSFLTALEQVTADQLTVLGTHYLTRAASRSVLLLPGQVRAGTPHDGPAREQPPRAEAPRDDLAREAATVALPAPAPPLAPEHAGGKAAPVLHSRAEVRAAAAAPLAGAARVARLANGLTVIVLRRPGLPFVSVLQGFRSSTSRDEPQGVRLAARFGRHHAFRTGPLARQLSWRGVESADDVREEIESYASIVDHAIDFLADEARTLWIKFPDRSFDRWLAVSAAREERPEGVAARRFESALWGDHPYGAAPLAVRVGERTQLEVERWIDRVERPANGAVVVVGDVDSARVVDSAARGLADAWHRRSRYAKPLPAAPPPTPRAPSGATAEPATIFTVASQRKTAAIQFGCLLPPVRDARAEIVDAFYVELVRQALFDRLRGDSGQSYAPDVRWTPLWGGSAVLTGEVDVPAAGAADGVLAVRSLLCPRGEPRFEATLVERARWRLALTNATRFSTNMQMARALFTAWKLGLPPSSLDEAPAVIASIEAGELEAAAQACGPSAVISVLGPVAP